MAGNTKIKGLKRIHLMLDPEAIAGLDWLAKLRHGENRSRAARACISDAVESEMRSGSSGKRSSRR